MGIPLIEIMKIYPFSRAKLIAGEKGLSRMVESANIQEVPHVARWMHGGEILFSAGYAFQNVESVITLMEEIYARGAAALALKPGQYLEHIPENMVACAERIGLPLFELPEDLPYMDCIIPIFERITEKQLTLLRRVENIYDQLMQSILRQEGLDGVCLTLHQVTSQPVFIFAPSGGVILASCLSNADSEHADYAAATKSHFEHYLHTRAVRALKPNQCNMLLFGKEQRVLCIPILVQDERFAYLLLDCTDFQLPDMDLIAFEHASSLIAIELLKEQALIEKEQKIREKLLEDLLMKRYGDERMICRRGLSVGINLENPYCIFTIDPDSFENYIYQELRNSTEADIQKIKTRIHEMIRIGMQDFCGPQLLLNNSVSVTGMITVLHKNDMATLREVLGSIIQKLKTIYPKLNFFAGIGRMKRDIREADISLRESKLALNCSKMPQFQKADATAAFEELGALSFLSELVDSATMRNYYEEHMGQLRAYDLEHNGELINTLDCYFQCNRNLRLTSEKLFIHKNSAIYRIRKIESLIGAPLTDVSTAFALQLCILLKNVL